MHGQRALSEAGHEARLKLPSEREEERTRVITSPAKSVPIMWPGSLPARRNCSRTGSEPAPSPLPDIAWCHFLCSPCPTVPTTWPRALIAVKTCSLLRNDKAQVHRGSFLTDSSPSHCPHFWSIYNKGHWLGCKWSSGQDAGSCLLQWTLPTSSVIPSWTLHTKH